MNPTTRSDPTPGEPEDRELDQLIWEEDGAQPDLEWKRDRNRTPDGPVEWPGVSDRLIITHEDEY